MKKSALLSDRLKQSINEEFEKFSLTRINYSEKQKIEMFEKRGDIQEKLEAIKKIKKLFEGKDF